MRTICAAVPQPFQVPAGADYGIEARLKGGPSYAGAIRFGVHRVAAPVEVTDRICMTAEDDALEWALSLFEPFVKDLEKYKADPLGCLDFFVYCEES